MLIWQCITPSLGPRHNDDEYHCVNYYHFLVVTITSNLNVIVSDANN